MIERSRARERALGVALVVLSACGSKTTTTSASSKSTARATTTSPTKRPDGATSAATSAASSAANPASPSGASKPTKTIRVYVAGESIERRNHFVEPPFHADGALNDRGGGEARNDDNEYGWMVPLADRLALRRPGLKVEWVGSDVWTDAEDNPYSGTYPPGGPFKTSAISGTSIESWLDRRAEELRTKSVCYDVAIAARGGNDFGDADDEAVERREKLLLQLLLDGSSCNARPSVYVTAHMPDDPNEGAAPAGLALVATQKKRFVDRFRAAFDAVVSAIPDARIHFVDLFTPFLENRATTAFPHEIWSAGGVPDYAKITRIDDHMHPRRLSCIYAGEIAADAFDLTEIDTP